MRAEASDWTSRSWSRSTSAALQVNCEGFQSFALYQVQTAAVRGPFWYTVGRPCQWHAVPCGVATLWQGRGEQRGQQGPWPQPLVRR
eukprot:967173-Pyramimonas_sp.AAC.1